MPLVLQTFRTTLKAILVLLSSDSLVAKEVPINCRTVPLDTAATNILNVN